MQRTTDSDWAVPAPGDTSSIKPLYKGSENVVEEGWESQSELEDQDSIIYMWQERCTYEISIVHLHKQDLKNYNRILVDIRV